MSASVLPRHLRVVAIFVVLAAISALSACGKATVVRDSGHRGKPTVVRSPLQRPVSRPVNRPKPGTSVVVRKGDTLYRLAVENGISPLDLAMWNRIPPPYTIYPGQRLRLSPSSERRDPPPRVANAPPGPVKPATSSGEPSGTAVGKPPATSPAPATNTKPPTGTMPQPVAASAPTAPFVWRWPAEGNIVGRFSAGDPTKQGIDIAGQNGAAVRAAADGVVVYSGAGLIGYGELIIVKHNEQWLSAYGHNRARLVNEGQRVKAGEQIAEMGRSGAARDVLHFEIRYNGKPQDPQQALPKR
jgi:lipoprotein NlpD